MKQIINRYKSLLKILCITLCSSILISHVNITVLAKESRYVENSSLRKNSASEKKESKIKNQKFDGAYDLETMDYVMKEEKNEFKDSDGVVRGFVSYIYPQFSGNSEAAKKVNKILSKECKKFMKSDNAADLEESVKGLIKSGNINENTFVYHYNGECKIVYNKNGIISIRTLYDWYAGGVNDYGLGGINYDLINGKKLNYKDVVSGNGKKKLLKSIKNTVKNKYDANRLCNAVKKIKNYDFYLQGNMVYVCFDKYEIAEGAAGAFEFPVKGKLNSMR